MLMIALSLLAWTCSIWPSAAFVASPDFHARGHQLALSSKGTNRTSSMKDPAPPPPPLPPPLPPPASFEPDSSEMERLKQEAEWIEIRKYSNPYALAKKEALFEQKMDTRLDDLSDELESAKDGLNDESSRK
ncbi:hypothetical protein JKP88DRAFT_249494 [Tribonema minus]|uniref:Uncharacterized protein n=1 Tax=Tribonema minus TaxID=303371 RepID=A0A835YML6_9STRA|nr:hypothetical protein JKP88DRAFT_249494 [Tribonema minus]